MIGKIIKPLEPDSDKIIFESKLILIPNFSSNVYTTNFFTNSWIKSDELGEIDLEKKLEELYIKDLKRDHKARRMDFLLVHDVRNKTSYLVDIKYFKDLYFQIKKDLFRKYDFYVPRSIWFLSFAMLNEKDLPILSDWTERI